MKITGAETLGFCDGAAMVFDVDAVPETHQEWAQAIGELPIAELFGKDLSDKPLIPHPDTSLSHSQIRHDSKGRDWWAGDMLLHEDGTRWPIQPVLTVIGCVEAEDGAPGTELIDTVGMLERVDEDGFFEDRGISIADMVKFQSIFADSTYYREALPHLLSLANHEDQLTISERLWADFAKAEVGGIDELADYHDRKFPPKAFPLVRTTWLDEYFALFMDGGGRNSRLMGPDEMDYTPVLHELRQTYLSGDKEKLREHDLVRTIGWAANRCIVFPQIGVLHRALPGNDHNRKLHLAFLADADAVAQAEIAILNA